MALAEGPGGLTKALVLGGLRQQGAAAALKEPVVEALVPGGERGVPLERIEWRRAVGRLVRMSPGDESATRARLSGFRVKVEEVDCEAARSPFVEVGIELDAPRPLGRTTGPKSKGPILYVGARPRAGGAGR